jgi:hypothetical protein
VVFEEVVLEHVLDDKNLVGGGGEGPDSDGVRVGNFVGQVAEAGDKAFARFLEQRDTSGGHAKSSSAEVGDMVVLGAVIKAREGEALLQVQRARKAPGGQTAGWMRATKSAKS